MKIFFCIVLVLYSCCMITLAYPMDYNETTVQEADEALDTLRLTILKTSFPSLFNEFLYQVAPVSFNVYTEISNIHERYSYRLIEAEENAKNLNANLSQCTETNNMPDVDEFYLQYESECEEVAKSVGKNIFFVGYNVQQTVFLKKYSELIHYYKGCLSPGDPAPMICVGVISATLEGVKRISPLAATYSFETQKNLDQEIVNLSKCANGKITDASQRIHSEFEKIMNCILSSVIIA